MGRSEHKMGAIASEERRFRELFRVGPAVALITWNMLCNLGFLPDGGTMLHFLWTLCFLKVYAKQAAMCVLYGAVDPKTAKKWVSQFIRAIADLAPHVVSNIRDCCIADNFTEYCRLFYIDQMGKPIQG